MADMVQVRRTGGQFSEEPDVRVGRSQFDYSHGLKIMFDASYLYPILVEEVLPGDTFTCSLDGFVRIHSPLDAPIMDNIELDTAFFFVPARLLWTNWKYFMGEHDDAGIQDTNYLVPIIGTGATVFHDGGGVTFGHLAAHFGLPSGLQTTQVPVNALPFRAYNLIYNQWYRDQNLIDEVAVAVNDGPDATGLYGLWKGAKKHDYFTSCLPYVQKGDPVIGTLEGFPTLQTSQAVGNQIAIFTTADSTIRELDSGAAQVDVSATVGSSAQLPYVDLSSVVGVDINSLRQALAIQRLLERDARGGTRYVEIIKSHFGVVSPDFRLQRSEYLGGGKSFINVSPVANTSSTATENQGELRGIGTGSLTGHSWAKSFTEHGYVLGIMRARGDLTYFQGIPRLYSRRTRFEFYMPELANLGEQSVLNKEIYVSNVPATDNAVFGYQERWSEYRFRPSRIQGKMNPDAAGSLSFWHLAEDFSALPALNQTFIEDQTPMARVTTVTTEPDFQADIWFNYKAARPIPVHSVPSILGMRF